MCHCYVIRGCASEVSLTPPTTTGNPFGGIYLRGTSSVGGDFGDVEEEYYIKHKNSLERGQCKPMNKIPCRIASFTANSILQ